MTGLIKIIFNIKKAFNNLRNISYSLRYEKYNYRKKERLFKRN